MVDALVPREAAPLEPREVAVVAAIVVLAIALRVVSMVFLPGSYHPDEVFQTTEQAHRIAFGYGIVPWEWTEGIRSPVVAWVLAQVMASAKALWGGPRGYLYGVRTFLVLASLAIVLGAWRLGRRVSVQHGIVAAFVTATWFELVHFASRPLYGSIATMLLIPALVLLSVPPDALRVRRLIAAGTLLGAAVAVRPHLAPTAVFVVAWSARCEIRKGWVPLVVAGALPVLLAGMVDWLWWGAPFGSYVAYVQRNLLDGVASTFGEQPGAFYLAELAVTWGAGLPIFLALAFLGGRRFPLWLGVAIIVLATHSVIGHKEYRFVLAAEVCLVILAAIQSADIFQWLFERSNLSRAWNRSTAWVTLLATFWMVSSVASAISGDNRNRWLKRRGTVQSTLHISAKNDVCGVGHVRVAPGDTGGYAYLHRDVPLYFFDEIPGESLKPAFNYVVSHGDQSELLGTEFSVDRCFCVPSQPVICVLRREGGCRPVAKLEPTVFWPPSPVAQPPGTESGDAFMPLPEVLPRACN